SALQPLIMPRQRPLNPAAPPSLRSLQVRLSPFHSEYPAVAREARPPASVAEFVVPHRRPHPSRLVSRSFQTLAARAEAIRKLAAAGNVFLVHHRHAIPPRLTGVDVSGLGSSNRLRLQPNS